jgi:hypothetical protein
MGVVLLAATISRTARGSQAAPRDDGRAAGCDDSCAGRTAAVSAHRPDPRRRGARVDRVHRHGFVDGETPPIGCVVRVRYRTKWARFARLPGRWRTPTRGIIAISKPDDILIGAKRAGVVTDFGIARARDGADVANRPPQGSCSTAAFMSPEQGRTSP